MNFKRIIFFLLIVIIFLLTFTGCNNKENYTQELEFYSISWKEYGVKTVEDKWLEKIVIPNRYKGMPVTTIAYEAFVGSNIIEITIPNNIKSIEEKAFYGTNLNSVTFGKRSKLKSIGRSAFCLTRISEITLPDGVESIGEKAFAYCRDLANITIPDNIKTIEEETFRDCISLTTVTFSAKSKLTSIGDSTFAFCTSLNSINIPNTVTSIGRGAFYECTSLESLILPRGIASIGDGTFAFCRNLTTINIPDGVTSIGNGAFSFCYSITDITIPSGVTSIGNGAFSDCNNITDITIPEGVTEIGDQAFIMSGITSINIPASVTSIGRGAFYGCNNLESIDVALDNPNYKSIDGVLYNKDATTLIRYPAGKKDTSFTIPNGVSIIVQNAFSACINLTSVVIPDHVTTIFNGGFGWQVSSCDNLTIYSENTSMASEWNSNWNDPKRPVVWGSILSEDKTYVISINTLNIENPEDYSLSNPRREGYTFEGWYTTEDFNGTKYDTIELDYQGILYVKWI